MDIVLLGTDTAGKVVFEQTKTVVLSRHGAGVVSRYRFSPDELLTLSLPSSAKETEIRLVGQMGGEPGRYIYGVAFVDADPHFWPMEFPEPESFESASPPLLLECSLCHTQQLIEQHEIEEDVYAVNEYILRPCEPCGTSTPWKKAQVRLPTAAAAPPKTFQTSLEISPDFRPAGVPFANGNPARAGVTSAQGSAPSSSGFAPGSPAASHGESFELGLSVSPASTAESSLYSGASTLSEFAPLTDLQLNAAQASPAVAGSASTAVLSPPAHAAAPSVPQVAPPRDAVSGSASRGGATRELDANGRPVNKRRNVRIRVSFAACVRHSAHADEVVECENVSKGGVCFHSLRQYPPDSLIEIAAPFSPGETALFIRARVKRIEGLSGGLVFRYGVEYVKL